MNLLKKLKNLLLQVCNKNNIDDLKVLVAQTLVRENKSEIFLKGLDNFRGIKT